MRHAEQTAAANLSSRGLTTWPTPADLPRTTATLNLRSNLIRDLPSPELHLHAPDLRELDLSNNLLDGLPPTLARLERLVSLRVDGNPLRSLPAGAASSWTTYSLLEYARDLRRPTAPWETVKVIALSDDDTERSALVSAMFPKSAETTVTATVATGVRVTRAVVPDSGIRVRVLQCDDGGEGEGGAEKGGRQRWSAGMFFSERAVYMVVFRMLPERRLDLMARSINRWLEFVVGHPANGDTPTVVLVGTNCDEVGKNDEARDLMLRLVGALRVPPARSFCVDLKSGTGMKELMQPAVWRDLLPVQHSQMLPGHFFALARYVRRRSMERKAVSLEEFTRWAAVCGAPVEEDPGVVSQALRLLNDSGYLIHFGPAAPDIVFLSAQLVAQYALPAFLSPKGGLLPLKTLQGMWVAAGLRPTELPLLSVCQRIGLVTSSHAQSRWVALPEMYAPGVAADGTDLLASHWSETPPEGVVQHTRLYDLAANRDHPEKDTRRLFKFLGLDAVETSHTSVVHQSRDEVLLGVKGDLPCTVLLRMTADPESERLNGETGTNVKPEMNSTRRVASVSFSVRLSADTAENKRAPLADMLRQLSCCVENASSRSGVPIARRFVVCPHCLLFRDPDRPPPTKFLFEDLAEVALSHSEATLIACTSHSGAASNDAQLPLSVLAPDLSLISLFSEASDTDSVRNHTVCVVPQPPSEKESRSSKHREAVAVAVQRALHVSSSLRGALFSPVQSFDSESGSLVIGSTPYGTLKDFIERAQGGARPEWRLRLLIAWDLACALLQMHSSTPPVSHCRLSHSSVNMASVSLDPARPRVVLDPVSSPYLPAVRWSVAPERVVASVESWCAPTLDVYSLGVLLWELTNLASPEPMLASLGTTSLLTGNIQQFEEVQLPAAALAGAEKLRNELSASAECPIYKTVLQCLSSDPECRPALHEVVKVICDALNAIGVVVECPRPPSDFCEGECVSDEEQDDPCSVVAHVRRFTCRLDDEDGYLQRRSVSCLSHCGDGRFITGTDCGHVIMWDEVTCAPIKSWKVCGGGEDSRASVTSLLLFRGCLWVATAEYAWGIVRVWSSEMQEQLHTASVIAIDYPRHPANLAAPSDLRLVRPQGLSPRIWAILPPAVVATEAAAEATSGSALRPGLLVVFDALTFGTCSSCRIEDGGPRSMCVSESCGRVFIGTTSGAVLAFSVDDASLVTRFDVCSPSPVLSMAIPPSTPNLVWCAGESVVILDATKGEKLPTINQGELPGPAVSLLCAPSFCDKLVCGGSLDGVVHFWDPSSRRFLGEKDCRLGSANSAVRGVCSDTTGNFWAVTTDTHDNIHVLSCGACPLEETPLPPACLSPVSAPASDHCHWGYALVQTPGSRDPEVRQLVSSLATFRSQFEQASFMKVISRLRKEILEERAAQQPPSSLPEKKKSKKHGQNSEVVSLKIFRVFCSLKFGELLAGLLLRLSLKEMASEPVWSGVSVTLHGNCATPLAKLAELSMVVGPEDIFVVADTVALSLAGTYADQIAVLTLRGARVLADSAVKVVAESLVSLSGKLQRLTLTEHALEAAATFPMSHPVPLDTKDGRLWTDEGVFQRTGIVTPNNEVFVPENHDPIYMFRAGSHQQAEKCHMRQNTFKHPSPPLKPLT